MNHFPPRQPTTKVPVDPQRVRHMPTQFAPVDRRLVYDRHLCALTHAQMALYLFLHCVADAAGLSYYSDERICQFLDLNSAALREARQGLVQRAFVLYCRPLYQLLDLPPAASSCRGANPWDEPCRPGNPPPRPSPRNRPCAANGEAIAIGEVISRWSAEGGPL